MRVGVIGRTGMLLDSAEAVREAGHEIVFVITCKSESFYEKKEFDFSEYANGLKVPFFNSIDLKHIVNEISALRADICISINWLNLIPENFLNIFPLGILNAHAGDLPRYKGNAVVNWAILNFEKRIKQNKYSTSSSLLCLLVLHRQYRLGLTKTDERYVPQINFYVRTQCTR